MDCYGLVVATEHEAQYIMRAMEEYLPDYQVVRIRENVYRYEMKNKRIFVMVSGIGMNNAIVAVSRLRDWFICDEIYNIGVCASIKGDAKIGDVIEFNKSVINYSFKYQPENYHYDDANLNDGVWDENGLLITCQEEANCDVIYNDIWLSNIKNIYLDMEGYGVASFCSQRALKFNIVKIVASTEINNDFTILGEDESLYKNIGNVLKKMIEGEV